MTCGIHITATHPCAHCARAAAHTSSALASVAPRPADRKKSVRHLTDEQADRVRTLHASGLSYREITQVSGLGKSTISQIVTGKSYGLSKEALTAKRNKSMHAYFEHPKAKEARAANHYHSPRRDA